jgi:hypothetical protein
MLIVVQMLKKWLLKSSGIYRMAIMHSMTLLSMALTGVSGIFLRASSSKLIILGLFLYGL